MSLAILPTITATEARRAILDALEEGVALHEQGDIRGAERIYHRVLKEHPGNPRATALIGLLAHVRGENGRALALFEQAAGDDPNDAFIHGNRGAILYSLGKMQAAIEAYIRSVEAWPGYAVGYANLGVVLAESFRQDEAAYAVTRAVELDPDHFDYGYLKPYVLDLAPSTTPELALAARRHFNARHVRPRLASTLPPLVDRTPGRKLRVGYVSSDFYQHSAMHAVGAVLLNHDPDRVEVVCYGSVERPDDITEQIKQRTTYVDINHWSEDKLALKIRRDRIDILVDLSAFTKGNHLRAFARRPAPVQVSAWGYATGTGLDCIDAVFSDGVLAPEADEWQYAERVIRLPSAIPWMRPDYDVDVGHVPSAFGRAFTFGVFNRCQKLNPLALDAWADILRRAPGSRIVIKSPGLDNAQTREMLIEHLKARGVFYDDGPTPGVPQLNRQGRRKTRVLIFGKSAHADQMAAHWPIDVVLDPFPMGGGISAAESLYMGIPLVTLHGDRACGRLTASLERQVGLDDWVAPTREAYVERAVRAAADPQALIPIRRRLRADLLASPVCQLRTYAGLVEDAYDELWARYCAESEVGVAS